MRVALPALLLLSAATVFGRNEAPARLERPVNLVWFVSPTAVFEVDWIHELLERGGVPYVDHFFYEEDENRTILAEVMPDALVTVSYLTAHKDYLDMYEDMRVPYGVLHLADEIYLSDKRFYNASMCQFVFRNYHHPLLSHGAARAVFPHTAVEPFALGYKAGFWAGYNRPPPALIDQSARPLMWSFSGCAHLEKLDRVLVLQAFYHLRPHAFLLTDDFNKGLHVTDYREWALQSKFVLCPVGHYNLDTFRVYEAMEAGAVPVVLSTSQDQDYGYFEGLFGVTSEEIPFVANPTWWESKEEVEALLADPDAYEARRLRVVTFWRDYKDRLAGRLRRRVEALLHGEPQQLPPMLTESRWT